MSLENDLNFLRLKKEDIFNSKEDPITIKEKIDAAGIDHPSTNRQEVTAAWETLTLAVIDKQTPLAADKFVFIFDFDLTLTINHTYNDPDYWKKLDADSVKANIRCFDQFKQFVKTALQQGHRIAIASFNDIHEEAVDPNTKEKIKRGYYLIKHYLNIIFADEPEIAKNIIIQAYQTEEKNKSFHVTNIQRALGATQNHVTTDDDLTNVNYELSHNRNAFLVAEDNFAELLARYTEALQNPTRAKNEITSYPNFKEKNVKKDFLNVTTNKTFNKKYKIYYRIIPLSLKIKHLLELCSALYADRALIKQYLEDSSVFKGVIASKASELFSSFDSKQTELINRDSETFRLLLTKITEEKIPWETFAMNLGSFVRNGQEANNDQLLRSLLDFLPENYQVELLSATIEEGFSDFITHVAKQHLPILQKYIATINSDKQVKPIGQRLIGKLDEKTTAIIAECYRTSLQISDEMNPYQWMDYLLFEIKLQNYEKFRTIWQTIQKNPNLMTIRAGLVAQLLKDVTTNIDKYPYFELLLNDISSLPIADLAKTLCSSSLNSGNAQEKTLKVFMEVISLTNDARFIKRMLEIYGNQQELNVKILFKCSLAKISKDKNDDSVAVYILKIFDISSSATALWNMAEEQLGLDHPFLATIKQILNNRNISFQEISLEEKLLREINHNRTDSATQILSLLNQGVKVTATMLQAAYKLQSFRLVSLLLEKAEKSLAEEFIMLIWRNIWNAEYYPEFMLNLIPKCATLIPKIPASEFDALLFKFIAINLDIVRLLLALGADFQAKDSNKQTLLEIINTLICQEIEKLDKSVRPEESAKFNILKTLAKDLQQSKQELQLVDKNQEPPTALAHSVKNNFTAQTLKYFEENNLEITSILNNDEQAILLLLIAINCGNYVTINTLLKKMPLQHVEKHGLVLLNQTLDCALTAKNNKYLQNLYLNYILPHLLSVNTLINITQYMLINLLAKILNNFSFETSENVLNIIVSSPNCKDLLNKQQTLTLQLNQQGQKNFAIICERNWLKITAPEEQKQDISVLSSSLSTLLQNTDSPKRKREEEEHEKIDKMVAETTKKNNSDSSKRKLGDEPTDPNKSQKTEESPTQEFH